MVLSDKLPAFSSSFTPRRPRQLAIIGGRLEADNRAVFDALKQKSQGRIAVFATASEIPDEVGGETVEDFTRYGFEAELIPLFHNNSHQAAFDEALIARVQRLGSVYFTGGDQARIIKALLGENGAGTPMLEVLQHLHAQGGLVAGSSAGAAMMPERIILRGTSLEALVDGINDGDGAVADDDHPRGLILGP
ncbi:MAG: cyanophycinase, partial [Candidatus Competibacterales bacterium]